MKIAIAIKIQLFRKVVIGIGKIEDGYELINDNECYRRFDTRVYCSPWLKQIYGLLKLVDKLTFNLET